MDSSTGHVTQDAPGVALKPGHNSRTCEQCGGKFSPRAASGGKPQKFCSPQCRTAFHADAQPNVSQRSPTWSAQTRLPAVIPHAKKDEPADPAVWRRVRYRPLRPPTRAAQERDPAQLEFDFHANDAVAADPGCGAQGVRRVSAHGPRRA
jgi:hypothetical protein